MVLLVSLLGVDATKTYAKSLQGGKCGSSVATHHCQCRGEALVLARLLDSTHVGSLSLVIVHNLQAYTPEAPL